ncbi:MAG: L,D-transpeptidase [Candidatus Berkelbacteria bacterium]|nr:L,D-transpeptidase [Candidatus Berkelbacteria bacterium]
MKKQKPIFLFSGLIVSVALLSSVTIGGVNINTNAFDNAYHKVANFIISKENYLRDWFSGKFGASADERKIREPQLNKVPFDIKAINSDIEPYILPQNEENKVMIIIIPGKSNWERQEEARIKAAEEEARKKAEEERKKKQVQVEDTGSFCGDPGSRYIELDLSSQRLALCNFGKTEGVFPISSGSRQYPTPTGHFQINSKTLRAYSSMYNLYMPYWNSFIGNSYGIHELPEYPNGYKEGANLLGQAVSHGCVRLGVGAAATVYNWAPVGTPVDVHL